MVAPDVTQGGGNSIHAPHHLLTKTVLGKTATVIAYFSLCSLRLGCSVATYQRWKTTVVSLGRRVSSSGIVSRLAAV